MKKSVLALALVSSFALVPDRAFSLDQVISAPKSPSTTVNTIRPVSLDEIKELSGKNISADIILNLLQNNPAVYTLSASDIIDLQSANVSPEVIKYLLSTRQSYPTQSALEQSPPAATKTQPVSTAAPAAVAVSAPLVPPSGAAPASVYAPSYDYYVPPYSSYRPSVTWQFNLGSIGFGHHGLPLPHEFLFGGHRGGFGGHHGRHH